MTGLGLVIWRTGLLALFVALLMVGCGEADLRDRRRSRRMLPLMPLTGRSYRIESAKYRRTLQWLRQASLSTRTGSTRFSPSSRTAMLLGSQWEKNGTPRWDIGYMEGKVGIEGGRIKKYQGIKEHGRAMNTRTARSKKLQGRQAGRAND